MDILVIIDMQNDFINGTLGTKEAEAIVPKVINRVKAARILDELIIYTQDTHDKDYLDTQEGEKLPVLHCQRCEDGWKVPDTLEKFINMGPFMRIEKSTFGTFAIKNAIETMQKEMNYKIDNIEVCGLCTDICVVTNALILKTAFPEVPITVCEELCAGVTHEKHQAALEVMRSCQINVISRENEEN